MKRNRDTLLIISQVFVPDPASVGQHLYDVATEMRSRGWRVVVFTSRRGFDDASVKYRWKETLNGVEIVRLPLSSFGKRSLLLRLMAGGLFTAQAALAGVFCRGLKRLLISTSPPIAPVSALLIGWVRKIRIVYWVMDINPDQMLALGRVSEYSPAVRLFNWMNRKIIRRADKVVTLDSRMAETLYRKVDVGCKIRVLPVWPHLEPVAIPHEENPFRSTHGLDGKFVVMYSGNHALSNPITTVLEAARRLSDAKDILFVFVGGGVGKHEVDRFIRQYEPDNVKSLPYQPLSELKYSLSAADVHVVSMGEKIIGICHPCKIYGIMAVGRPVLYLGAEGSPASDLISEYDIGWRVAHGDVDRLTEILREVQNTGSHDLDAMGERGRNAVRHRFSMKKLRGELADLIE